MAPPPIPRKWLFICTGNACRSVMAQFLLEELARRENLPWQARSCGVAASEKFGAPPEVWRALKVPPPDPPWRPTPVNRELLTWCDTALTMTREQRDWVAQFFPGLEAKVHVLRPFVGLPPPEDIADPVGGGDEEHLLCRREIASAVEALAGLGSP